MDTAMISKLDKAKRYAGERQRMQVSNLAVRFEGDNGTHNVTLADGRWHCDCRFFENRDWCCHTVALERVLEKMVPASAPVPG